MSGGKGCEVAVFLFTASSNDRVLSGPGNPGVNWLYSSSCSCNAQTGEHCRIGPWFALNWGNNWSTQCSEVTPVRTTFVQFHVILQRC